MPYVGGLIAFFANWFSLHGLIGFIIFIFLLFTGIKLNGFGRSNKRKLT